MPTAKLLPRFQFFRLPLKHGRFKRDADQIAHESKSRFRIFHEIDVGVDRRTFSAYAIQSMQNRKALLESSL